MCGENDYCLFVKQDYIFVLKDYLYEFMGEIKYVWSMSKILGKKIYIYIYIYIMVKIRWSYCKFLIME